MPRSQRKIRALRMPGRQLISMEQQYCFIVLQIISGIMSPKDGARAGLEEDNVTMTSGGHHLECARRQKQGRNCWMMKRYTLIMMACEMIANVS